MGEKRGIQGAVMRRGAFRFFSSEKKRIKQKTLANTTLTKPSRAGHGRNFGRNGMKATGIVRRIDDLGRALVLFAMVGIISSALEIFFVLSTTLLARRLWYLERGGGKN